MKKLDSVKIGDRVRYRSYEGVKETGSGVAVDVWKQDGVWFATLQRDRTRFVCVMDSDLDQQAYEDRRRT